MVMRVRAVFGGDAGWVGVVAETSLFFACRLEKCRFTGRMGQDATYLKVYVTWECCRFVKMCVNLWAKSEYSEKHKI